MIRGRRLARYTDDGRCHHDFVAVGLVTLKKDRPLVTAATCREFRERIWRGLRESGFTGDDIARICKAAARHPDHINRAMKALRRQDRETDRAEAG